MGYPYKGRRGRRRRDRVRSGPRLIREPAFLTGVDSVTNDTLQFVFSQPITPRISNPPVLISGAFNFDAFTANNVEQGDAVGCVWVVTYDQNVPSGSYTLPPRTLMQTREGANVAGGTFSF
jgi:hypothetical protein